MKLYIYLNNIISDTRANFEEAFAYFSFSRDLIQLSITINRWFSFDAIIFKKAILCPKIERSIILFAIKVCSSIFFWSSIVENLGTFLFRNSVIHVTDVSYICVCVKLLALVSFETKTVKLIAWLHSGARARSEKGIFWRNRFSIN